MKISLIIVSFLGAGITFVSLHSRTESTSSIAQQNSVDSREPQKLTGFRYQDCGVQDCVVIEAPAAWLSQMSNFGDTGSHFLAEGPVKMQILREGRLWRQYQGESASLQSEVKLLSMETPRGSVLFDLETRQVDELFTANQQGVSGGGAL